MKTKETKIDTSWIMGCYNIALMSWVIGYYNTAL